MSTLLASRIFYAIGIVWLLYCIVDGWRKGLIYAGGSFAKVDRERQSCSFFFWMLFYVAAVFMMLGLLVSGYDIISHW